MKKQKGKDRKSGGAKKKEEAPETTTEETEQGDTSTEHHDAANDGQVGMIEPSPPNGAGDVSEDKQPEAEVETPPKQRQPSMSLQSKMRSSSFRRMSVSQGPLSPNGARSPELPVLSPDGDSVNSIYRKQAARLDELEKENKRLAKEAKENENKWKQTEEELEELR